MINRYYQLPAWNAGINDFLASRYAAIQEKEALEKGYQAQADAQRNQAIAGAVGNVATAGIGAYAASKMPDLSQLEQLQLASSFSPALGGIGQAAGAIGNRRAASAEGALNRQARADLRGQISQSRLEEQAAELYAAKYGQQIPNSLAGFEGLTGGLPIPPADGIGPTQGVDAGTMAPNLFGGGMPSPTHNPASTASYRRAQRLTTAYDNMPRGGMDPSELQAIEQQIGPQVQQARELLKNNEPPPPPVTHEELLEAGPHNGGYTMFPDGRVGSVDDKGKWTYGQPVKFNADEVAFKRYEASIAQEMELSGSSRHDAARAVNERTVKANLIRQYDDDGNYIGMANVSGGDVDWDEVSGRGSGTDDDFMAEFIKNEAVRKGGDFDLEKTIEKGLNTKEKIDEYNLGKTYRKSKSMDELMSVLFSRDPKLKKSMEVVEQIQAMSMTGDVDPKTQLIGREAARYIGNALGAVERISGGRLAPPVVAELQQLQKQLKPFAKDPVVGTTYIRGMQSNRIPGP